MKKKRAVLMMALIIAGLMVLLTFTYLGQRNEQREEAEREKPVQKAGQVAMEKDIKKVRIDPSVQEKCGFSLTSVRSEAGAILVPSSAVVWSEGRPFVYMREEANEFVRREIIVARSLNDRVAVKGLPLQAIVVTTGAQVLLSEELKSEIQIEGGEGDKD